MIMGIATRTKLIATAGAALLLVSCGGSNDNEAREQQIEAIAKKHGVDADVMLDGSGEVKSVVINGAGGAQVGNNLQLPDGFPEDVPMAQDWAIMAVSPTPGGFMVNARTTASVDQALAAAREQLTAHGWAETGFSQPAPIMKQVEFSKDDRITNLNLTSTGAESNVQLVTMTRPQ